MRKVIGLVDTDVYLALLIRGIPRCNQTNTKLKNYYACLQITEELIHEAVYGELIDILVKHFGIFKAKILLSCFLQNDHYKFIELKHEDRSKLIDSITHLRSNHKNYLDTRHQPDYQLTTKETKLLIAAIEIAKNKDFDDFRILTYSQSLRTALATQTQLTQYIEFNLPDLNGQLGPVDKNNSEMTRVYSENLRELVKSKTVVFPKNIEELYEFSLKFNWTDERFEQERKRKFPTQEELDAIVTC
jgi:hypothetical protein